MQTVEGSKVPIGIRGSELTVALDMEVNQVEGEWQVLKKTAEKCHKGGCAGCNKSKGFKSASFNEGLRAKDGEEQVEACATYWGT